MRSFGRRRGGGSLDLVKPLHEKGSSSDMGKYIQSFNSSVFS
jgi:hypothetical protein